MRRRKGGKKQKRRRIRRRYFSAHSLIDTKRHLRLYRVRRVHRFVRLVKSIFRKKTPRLNFFAWLHSRLPIPHRAVNLLDQVRFHIKLYYKSRRVLRFRKDRTNFYLTLTNGCGEVILMCSAGKVGFERTKSRR